VSCAEGQQPINPNPCLSGIDYETVNGAEYGLPWEYSLTIGEDQYGKRNNLPITPIADSYMFDLEGWAGSAQLTMHNLTLETSQCYLLIVDAYVNAEYTDYQAAKVNFFLGATVYLDGEQIVIGQEPFVIDEGKLTASLEGFRHYLIPFYTARQEPTIALGVGPYIIWGNGLAGTRMNIFRIIVEQVEPGHCAGHAGF